MQATLLREWNGFDAGAVVSVSDARAVAMMEAGIFAADAETIKRVKGSARENAASKAAEKREKAVTK